MARIRRLALAAFALGGFAFVAEGAELPSQVKKPPSRENTAAARKCNVGGLTGVLATNGVCVRMSGSISAGVGGGQIK